MNESPFACQTDKKGCTNCARHVFCLRLHKILSTLAVAEETQVDLEFRIRFQSLLQELVSLGYDYPFGHESCQLSERDSRPNIELLREAQELLIDVKNFIRFGESERKSI